MHLPDPRSTRDAPRLRVLVVGPSLDIIGGQSTQAALLIDGLHGESSVESSFVAINPRLPGVLRNLQSIKYVRTIVTSCAYVLALLRNVPRHDVVHVFSAAYLSFVIAPTPAILISRCFRKAIVLHYHAGEADAHLRKWRRTAARTMRVAHAIVVPSRYLESVFARHGMRVRVIRNVVEPDRLRFRQRRPLRPIFLSNRQLLATSNVECILRAFALVQRRFADAQLVVASDGTERAALQRLARELGLRQTEFIGWVAPDQIADLYWAADIFLNGSDSGDNVPVSILEAFAAGLPVVSTEAGGIPELVCHRETGMLVPRGDHEQMATCAIRLLEDPALSSKLVRNARDACSRFTWSACREQWLGLYTDLAGRRQR